MSVYAQEYGYFFNSNNSDRKYNAESFETWLKPFFVSGVFTGCLQVSAQSTPDMTVQVSGGYANLDGKLGYWEGSNTLQLSTASGVYSRYDTIVLRRDNTNRQVSIEVVTGVASSNPQPTAPARTSDLFELVLAEILVVAGATEITGSKITDKRPDSTVCGYVVTAVDTPDFTELFAQFTAQAEEFMGEQAAEFLDWFDDMKDQLSEDAAGHLQLEIDDLQDQIGTVPEGEDLQSEIDAAADEIGRISDAMCFVVNGNKSIESVSIPIGHYVRLANSTIADRADGLYTAKKAIPPVQNDTAIDASYLNEASPISGGLAESLNSNITTINSNTPKYKAIEIPNGSSSSFTFSNNTAFTIQITRHNSTDLGHNGFYIGQAHNNGVVKPVMESSTVTVSISGRTLTFTGSATNLVAYITYYFI